MLEGTQRQAAGSARVPRVTVGITFRNAQSTLLQAIRSVLAQSFCDWELILLDDASTDSSLEIARDIADSRVLVLSAPNGIGSLSASLNQITAATRTEYLARMDADDLMHPARLERQVGFLDEHPEIDIVGTGAYTIDRAGGLMGLRRSTAPRADPKSTLTRCPYIHPTVTARTQWFRDNPYDPSYSRAEDHELWCRTGQSTRFGYIPDPLLFYREGPGVARKYAETCRGDRRVVRTYGPSQVGAAHTAALLILGYTKPLVYSMCAALRLENWILRRRNTGLSARQVQDGESALRAVHA